LCGDDEDTAGHWMDSSDDGLMERIEEEALKATSGTVYSTYQFHDTARAYCRLIHVSFGFEHVIVG